jgi:hypothetical protein
VVQISKALHSSIGLLFVVSFVNKFKCFFHAGQRLLISIIRSGMLNEGSNIVVRISVGDLFGTIGGTGRFSQSEPFYSFCPSLFDFCRRPNQSALFSISPFSLSLSTSVANRRYFYKRLPSNLSKWVRFRTTNKHFLRTLLFLLCFSYRL